MRLALLALTGCSDPSVEDIARHHVADMVEEAEDRCELAPQGEPSLVSFTEGVQAQVTRQLRASGELVDMSCFWKVLGDIPTVTRVGDALCDVVPTDISSQDGGRRVSVILQVDCSTWNSSNPSRAPKDSSTSDSKAQ